MKETPKHQPIKTLPSSPEKYGNAEKIIIISSLIILLVALAIRTNFSDAEPISKTPISSSTAE